MPNISAILWRVSSLSIFSPDTIRFGVLINGGVSVNDAADGNNSAVNAAGINRHAFGRRNRQYPYKSRGQWFKAVWGFTGTSLFALFNGWQSFTRPFSPADFVASYISVSIIPSPL
jgi:hypothetical protein